ncbi:MAG: ATP-binding protein [Bacteroidota bacterium]|nr:ATP-binding protein [Candidatus Kapabacteria bacterium]MDW8219847.1 ATP-binding protein [Bacteroidota bacterium]
MKIRTRLALLFCLLTASILAVFATLVYLSAEKSREREFYESLTKEAITKANLFIQARVDATTLQTIYRNNRAIVHEVEVAIYDTSFRLLYHDAVEIDVVKETHTMIDSIKQFRELRSYQGLYQVVGLLFQHNGAQYVVTAAAFDQYGYNKLEALRSSMLVISICSLVCIACAGWFFAGRVLLPINAIVQNVKDITATNLDLRLPTVAGNDELGELIATFNAMLDRLDHSFAAQKQFVFNISHELRTPLAALLAELQITAEKERSTAEYQRAIEQAITDTQRLIRLANSLLDLAKASYDASEISFKDVRLDELIIEARSQVLSSINAHAAGYKVSIVFEREIEDDDCITVRGNEYLLRVALVNLIENGCKFSPSHTATIALSYNTSHVIVRCTDTGIGIPAEELPLLFTPFYRGSNRHYADGNGIGLSLTRKIITLHSGTISVVSERNSGTTFTLEFPHLYSSPHSSNMQ